MFAEANPTPAAIRSYFAYSMQDFEGLGLGLGWDYLVKSHGCGRKLLYPILMKPMLDWTCKNFRKGNDGQHVEFARSPVEKVLIRCLTDAFKVD